MTQAVEALPDDPNQLKALLLAERARNERLVQIIKEMQRHRFGCRAETLPEDQMLLALEDVEQTEAGVAAAKEGRIEIDSNVVERAIRPIALNRKNVLFAGSAGGGENWAIIASLIETCNLL